MRNPFSELASLSNHSRREWWWSGAAVAASLAVVAFLFRGYWTPERFLAGADTFSHDYPMWAWGWRTLISTGRIPLWNPFLFSGWPAVASFAFCPFYPPAWVSVPLPTGLAITSQYALHLALGAVGFYAFGRSMRWQPWVALVVALLYESACHVSTLAYPGHLAKVQAIAWLPWAMAAAVMLARHGGMRWAAALGIAGAMQLLASHTQIWYATFALAGAYVLAASMSSFRMTGRAIRLLAGALACTVLLSAVQMFPAVAMGVRSNRGGGGLDVAEAAMGELPPNEALEFALPSFRGDSTGTLRAEGELPYMGSWNAPAPGMPGERLVSDYVGIWALLLALCSLFSSRGRARWFFLIAAAASLAVAVGRETPLFAWAVYLLPGFSRFRSPGTFMVVLHFSLFALGGLGLQSAVKAWREPRSRKGLTVSLLSLGLIGAVGYGLLSLRVVLLGEAFAVADDSTGYASPLLLAMAWRHVLFFLMLGGLFWGVGLFCLSRGFSRWAILLLCAGVVSAMGDGLAQARRFLPKDSTARLDYFLNHYWIESAVLRHAGEAPLPTVITMGQELSNRPMMRRVRTPLGYHPVIFDAYDRMLRNAGGVHSPNTDRILALNYRVMADRNEIPEGWSRVAGSAGQILLARREPIPPARIPLRIEPTGALWDEMPDAEWKEIIGSPIFDPGRVSYCEGDYRWQWSQELMGSPPVVRLEVDPPNRLLLAMEEAVPSAAASDGIIPCVVSVPAAPGWRVGLERDGRVKWLPDWPRRANGFVMIAPLSTEPGVRTVLAYRPLSFHLGAAASLFGLAGLASWLAGGAVRRKRDARSGGISNN